MANVYKENSEYNLAHGFLNRLKIIFSIFLNKTCHLPKKHKTRNERLAGAIIGFLYTTESADSFDRIRYHANQNLSMIDSLLHNKDKHLVKTPYARAP